MKHIFLLLLLLSQLFSSMIDLSTFKADFTQKITDDKDKVLTYTGEIIASKNQKALWIYKSPVQKSVYLNRNKVTIIEPEIEQVIIRYIKSSFNFFNMLKNAKEISKDKYVTNFNNVNFTITIKDNKIYSINYLDEFENKVTITFTNQQQNIDIDENIFVAKYNLNFDIIRD